MPFHRCRVWMVWRYPPLVIARARRCRSLTISLSKTPGTVSVYCVCTHSVPVVCCFCRLGCLACSVSYWDWPGCIGCRTSGTFLCFEGFVSRCKFVDTPVTPLLCTAADVECVKPRTCCQIYEQFFCFECFCAVPPTNDGYKTVPTGLVDVAGQVFPEDIPVWR
jgi:hypothetical protein